MVRLPAPAAMVVSKAMALEDMNPRVFGVALVIAAAVLIASGLQSAEKS